MASAPCIAAVIPGGALKCAICVEVAIGQGEDYSTWYALTADEIADQGEAMFQALLPDAADLYPDMPIDPRVIAQLSALPVCDTCGIALAKVN